MERRNVGTIRKKSPKQGLTSTKSPSSVHNKYMQYKKKPISESIEAKFRVFQDQRDNRTSFASQGPDGCTILTIYHRFSRVVNQVTAQKIFSTKHCILNSHGIGYEDLCDISYVLYIRPKLSTQLTQGRSVRDKCMEIL